MKFHLLLSALLIAFEASSAIAAPEVCGNGIDDDTDGFADETCYVGLTTPLVDSPLPTADTGLVSPSTGALYYQLPADLALRVPWGPSLSFQRVYTSMYNPGSSAPAYRKPLGDRWQHNWMSWLDDSGTTLVIHMPTGQDVLAQYTSTSGGCDNFETRAGRATQGIRRCPVGGSTPGYFLKTLEGATLKWDITSKKLVEVWDTLATPNKLVIAYDLNGQVSTVTDAASQRRLLFGYTSGLLSSIKVQAYHNLSWPTFNTTTFSYTGGLLTSVTWEYAITQTHSYTNGYLTRIEADGKAIVSFSYDAATPGKVVRIDTARGMVGFEFASSRASCSGKTVLYFNRGNSLSCNVDGDCGSGFLCGGKTGAGSTGQCFRAARCLTVDSTPGHHEDLVTSVAPLGPPGESCEGACTDVAEYLWDNATRYVASLGIQDPSGSYTVNAVNVNGLPTIVSYGDPDSNPSNGNGARALYYFYDATFPGRISEIRRKSDLSPSASSCSATNTTGCARTRYTYNANGLLAQIIEDGFTLDSTGAIVSYSYTTTRSYDTVGRVTQIDGPLTATGSPAGVGEDVTSFTYWTVGAYRVGYLSEIKRWTGSRYLTTTAIEYDHWGNPARLRGFDTDSSHTAGTETCLFFDWGRNYLNIRAENMAGQTGCNGNSLDIVPEWTRDSALRLTRLKRPDGSCMFYEYDSNGRLQRTKRRDDCNSSSSGDKQEYIYDSDGLVTEIQTYDAGGVLRAKQSFEYYDSRRLQRVINPVDPSKWTGITYDARGFISEVQGAGSLGKTVFHVDAEGRTTAVDKYKDATLFDTWNLLYSWLGEQTRVTDGDSKATETIRDDLGRVVKLVSPDMAYPTLRVYDPASRLITEVEAFGGAAPMTHQFTYDAIGRPLTANYHGVCPTGTPQPEIQRAYDSPPSCEIDAGCYRTGGKLAYVKVSLMCSSLYSGSDGSLDQETWYSYDDAGRVYNEQIRDDSGRSALQSNRWTKNSDLERVYMPSGYAIGWTYGSTGKNSDTDLIAGQWRTSTATPVTHGVEWFPYGPLKRYDWEATYGGSGLETVISRNLAYRMQVIENGGVVTSADVMLAVTLTEDAKGRVTARDYNPDNATGTTGLFDSYFLYDHQDRVTCETTTYQSTCPTSGTGVKNNHLSGFTDAGDWAKLLHPIPGSSGLLHHFNPSGYGSSHQVTTINQDGTPAFGDTNYNYDDRGNRKYDDNTSTLTHDRREYTYDGRGNVINVRGEYYTGSAWHYYDVASAFDHQNRRVYKSFYDETTGKTAHWFFYYDPFDRLTEVRHTPDASVPATYSVFQLFWLGDQLTLYWQTDYPSVTTSKRYTATDETGRVLMLVNWPASGSAARYWYVNPTAWGGDESVYEASPNVYQPLLFAGQYKDDETRALLDDGATIHRPGVVLNGFRTYDPFIGGYLQIDEETATTWLSYVYASSDPVGKRDPDGRLIVTVRWQLSTGAIESNGGWTLWGGGDASCADINELSEGPGCIGGGGGFSCTNEPCNPQCGTCQRVNPDFDQSSCNQCKGWDHIKEECGCIYLESKGVWYCRDEAEFYKCVECRCTQLCNPCLDPICVPPIAACFPTLIGVPAGLSTNFSSDARLGY